MEVKVMENGALKITIEDVDRESLERNYQERGEMSALIDLLEPCWTNGQYHPFDAGEGNPFVGLTEAPCIAESLDYREDGKKEVGQLWWYPNYMVTSLVEKLLENGEVYFASAQPKQEVRPGPRR